MDVYWFLVKNDIKMINYLGHLETARMFDEEPCHLKEFIVWRNKAFFNKYK